GQPGIATATNMGAIPRRWENRRRAGQHHRRNQIVQSHGSKDMSLDDLPAGAPPRHEPETVVRRVDRASPYQDKITRAEELPLQLADEIVRGALPPGAALDETDIARRFKVSRTPVREALRQLVASGLVEARAHRGAVVARPSIERLTGMFEAVAELEALCAGLAAERMLPAERH